MGASGRTAAPSTRCDVVRRRNGFGGAGEAGLTNCGPDRLLDQRFVDVMPSLFSSHRDQPLVAAQVTADLVHRADLTTLSLLMTANRVLAAAYVTVDAVGVFGRPRGRGRQVVSSER
jgi:hypothetical protein